MASQQFESLYDVIKKTKFSPHSLRKKIFQQLIKEEEDRDEHFWHDVAKGNILTVLYLTADNPDLKNGKKMYEKCLKLEPDNLNAKNNKDEYKNEKKSTENSDESSDYKFQKIVADGEKARFLALLSPLHYIEAITIYEQIIASTDELQVTQKNMDGLVNKRSTWKYHCALCYNRLLNKGFLEIALKKYETIEAIYEKIQKLLKPIAEDKNNYYHEKALIDLVDSYFKYQNLSGKQIEFSFQTLDAINLIAKLCSTLKDKVKDNHYVLEKIGRILKQNSSSVEELWMAINILDMCPDQHVAWHQKALAYQYLYSLKSNSKKSILLTNKCRQPNSNNNINSKNFKSLPKNEKSVNSSESVETKLKDVIDFIKSNPHSFRPKFKPPHSKQNKLNKMENPNSRPDYFAYRRVKNDICEPTDENRYLLEEALKCFKKALELTEESSARYFIDAARVCICLQKNDEVKAYFRRAQRILNESKNNNDAAYLYEQWGLWKMGKTETLSDLDKLKHKLSKAKEYFYDSIKNCVEAKLKWNVSFDKLLNIIEKEKDFNDRNRNECNELNEEKLKLSMLIEHFNYPEKVYSEFLEKKSGDKSITKVIREIYNYLVVLHKLFMKSEKINKVDQAMVYCNVLKTEVKNIKELWKKINLEEKEKVQSLQMFFDLFQKHSEYKQQPINNDLEDLMDWIVPEKQSENSSLNIRILYHSELEDEGIVKFFVQDNDKTQTLTDSRNDEYGKHVYDNKESLMIASHFIVYVMKMDDDEIQSANSNTEISNEHKVSDKAFENNLKKHDNKWNLLVVKKNSSKLPSYMSGSHVLIVDKDAINPKELMKDIYYNLALIDFELINIE